MRVVCVKGRIGRMHGFRDRGARVRMYCLVVRRRMDVGDIFVVAC